VDVDVYIAGLTKQTSGVTASLDSKGERVTIGKIKADAATRNDLADSSWEWVYRVERASQEWFDIMEVMTGYTSSNLANADPLIGVMFPHDFNMVRLPMDKPFTVVYWYPTLALGGCPYMFKAIQWKMDLGSGYYMKPIGLMSQGEHTMNGFMDFAILAVTADSIANLGKIGT